MRAQTLTMFSMAHSMWLLLNSIMSVGILPVSSNVNSSNEVFKQNTHFDLIGISVFVRKTFQIQLESAVKRLPAYYYY